nr:unnamed protein product [Digitaria exilis]
MLPQKEWRVKKDDQPKPAVQAVQSVVQVVQIASAKEPPAQPVRPVEAEILPDDSSSARMVCCDELTSVPSAEDDEQLVDYTGLIGWPV